MRIFLGEKWIRKVRKKEKERAFDFDFMRNPSWRNAACPGSDKARKKLHLSRVRIARFIDKPVCTG
jgi:hypothetical protein